MVSKLSSITFLAALVIPLISYSKDCAKIQVLSGSTCDKLEVKFVFKGCESDNFEKLVKTHCKGNEAEALFRSEKNAYRAMFQQKINESGPKAWILTGPISATPLVAESVAASPTAKEAAEAIAPAEALKPESKEERAADGETDPGEGKLLSYWGGARKKMSKFGLSIQPSYSGELGSVLSGGVAQRTNYLGKVYAIIDQDLEKGIGWKGGSAHFYLMNLHGSGPNANVGDSQQTSNMNAAAATRIYEAYLQQSIFDGAFSILAGLYDFNTEFYVTNNSLIFLNGSFGAGAEVAQAANGGSNSPSIFPLPSFGTRVKIVANTNLYMQAAVLDGVSGDPANSSAIIQIHPKKADGMFVATEVGYNMPADEKTGALPGKIAFGTWTYTEPFTSWLSSDKKTSYGFYGLFEKTIISNLSAFLRMGHASGDVNKFRSNYSAGVV